MTAETSKKYCGTSWKEPLSFHVLSPFAVPVWMISGYDDWQLELNSKKKVSARIDLNEYSRTSTAKSIAKSFYVVTPIINPFSCWQRTFLQKVESTHTSRIIPCWMFDNVESFTRFCIIYGRYLEDRPERICRKELSRCEAGFHTWKCTLLCASS